MNPPYDLLCNSLGKLFLFFRVREIPSLWTRISSRSVLPVNSLIRAMAGCPASGYSLGGPAAYVASTASSLPNTRRTNSSSDNPGPPNWRRTSAKEGLKKGSNLCGLLPKRRLNSAIEPTEL